MKIRGTIPPDYQKEPTELEKIHSIFQSKWESGKFEGNGGRHNWNEYLQGLGLEIVGPFWTDPLDAILEMIYSKNLSKIVIKNPDEHGGEFILLDRDFAKKVLVLGELP